MPVKNPWEVCCGLLTAFILEMEHVFLTDFFNEFVGADLVP